MNLREKYKKYYETDEWFDNILNKIKQYPSLVDEQDVTKKEKEDIIENCEKILAGFDGIKNTKEYTNFKASQAEFFLNLFDTLNSTQWDDIKLKTAVEEINKEKNIANVAALPKIYQIGNAYSLMGNVLVFSDEISMFYKKINENIKEYSTTEILKYKTTESIPKTNPTKFEKDYLNFYNLTVPLRYNNDINYPSEIHNLLEDMFIRDFVLLEYSKKNNEIIFNLSESYADSINLYMFSNSFHKQAKTMSDSDIEVLMNTITRQEYNEVKVLLQELDNVTIGKFLKPWFKRVFTHTDEKERKKLIEETFIHIQLPKTIVREVLFEVGYELTKEDNAVPFNGFLVSQDTRSINLSVTDFLDFVKEKDITKAIIDNKTILDEEEEIQSRTIVFDYEKIICTLGSNHTSVLNYLNTHNLRVSCAIDVNKVYITFMHANIDVVSQKDLNNTFNKILCKAYFAQKENVPVGRFQEKVVAEIKKVVLETKLEVEASKDKVQPDRRTKKI